MKTFTKYLGFLFFSAAVCTACQKENLEIDAPSLVSDKEGRATVELAPALGAEIFQEAEILPMTRAVPMIRTRLTNRYQAVIIKKTDNKWVVDTLILGKIDPSIHDSDYFPRVINVYDTLALPVLKLALTPGTYKAGFFLNANTQNWNPDIKPGFVVSEKMDITPEDDLPFAYTYKIQQDDHFSNYQCVMLNEEPFAGWTSFTIRKNDTLQQNAPLPRQKLVLKRRATRFRYLLKDTVVNVNIGKYPYSLSFENTNYYFRGDFKVPQETPFCQGLNILGGGYYPSDSTCLSLRLYISTAGALFTSPVDSGGYRMATPQNSTYRSYYILMDEYYPDGFQCEISNIFLSGASYRPTFIYVGSITRNFRINKISGVVFQPSSRGVAVEAGEQSTFYIEEDTEADAVSLFSPFYELNPKFESR